MKNTQDFNFIALLNLLIFICLSLHASDAEKISLKLNNAPLKTALKEISRQTEINFVYASSAVDSVTVSCDFTETPLTDALQSLLRQTKLTFQRANPKQILIYKKATKSEDVSGSVIDAQSGESLPYANISIRHTVNGASANSDGRFVLKNVQRPCTLDVHYIGYTPEMVVLSPDRALNDVNIALKQSTINLKGITVRPRQWEAFEIAQPPGQLSISPYHFSDLPIIGDLDISRSLQLMPGIQNSSYGGSGLHIRAGRPSQNLVLLDGMTLYHMDHSFGFFSAFNAQAIKDVRVYKSGFPAKFGGRLSGVMELTAKSGNFHRPRLSVGANLMSAQAVLEIPLAGHGALLLSGRRSITEHILSTLQNRVFNTILNDISPFHYDDSVSILKPARTTNMSFYDGIGKLTLTPSRNDIITLSYYLGSDDINNVSDYGDVLLFVDDSTFTTEREIVEQESRWGNFGISGRWYRQWRNLQSIAQLTYSDYFTRFNIAENLFVEIADEDSSIVTIPGETRYDNDVEDLTFRLDNNWQLSERQSLEFGLAYTKSTISLKWNGYAYVEEDIATDAYNLDETATLLSAYAEDTWQPFANTRLRAGLRANYYDPSDFSSPSTKIDWEPRLSFEYQFSKNLLVKSAWGRFYQYIMQFGDDFQYIDGNVSWILADRDGLKPGFSEHRILGLQYQYRGFLFDVEFYHKKLEGIFEPFNYRQFVSRDTLADPAIQRDGTASGLDIHIRQNTGAFTGWLSYSYSRARMKNGALSYPADQDTPHDLKLVGSIGIGGWNLSATWQYVSGKPYSKPDLEIDIDPGSQFRTYVLLAPQLRNTERLPAAHHLNLSLTRTFSNSRFNGKMGVSIFNVYNRENTWYRYFTVRNGELAPVDVRMFGLTPSLFLEIKL